VAGMRRFRRWNVSLRSSTITIIFNRLFILRLSRTIAGNLMNRVSGFFSALRRRIHIRPWQPAAGLHCPRSGFCNHPLSLQPGQGSGFHNKAGRYGILGVRMRKVKKIADRVLSHPGSYRQVHPESGDPQKPGQVYFKHLGRIDFFLNRRFLCLRRQGFTFCRKLRQPLF